MSNKLISLLLTIYMLFCLSACGTTEISSNPINTPSESQTDITQDTDENTSNKENSQVSSNTEESSDNNTETQSSTNQSNPTDNTNQPTHTHSYSNATCTSPKKCSCGASIGTVLGHNYSKATCTSPKKCTRCGVIAGTALGHSYSSATCTSPKICVRCDLVSGSALGHKYLDATCTRPRICERCDSIAEGALGHDFRNKKCTRCGKLDRTYLIEDIDYLRKNDDIWHSDEAITDNKGTVYSDHLNFHNNNFVIDGSIYFDIGRKYTSFTGTVLLPYEKRGTNREGYIKIYADDKLLYQTSAITMGYQTNTFTVDVTGISILEIEMDSTSSAGGTSCVPYLTNAYLEK